MGLTETESLLLDIVTKATVVGDAQGYKPEYTKDKTEWKMLMRLKNAGLVEERRAGPRGGKRFFAISCRPTPPTLEDDEEGFDQGLECKLNGHRDTGRGVCANCGKFLEPDKPEAEAEPKAKAKATPMPGLSLTLTADGGVKLS